MDPMKRVRLAVVFLVAAALLASTPVLAAPKNRTLVIDLMPVGDEPGASGKAYFVWDPQPWSWEVLLNVSASGLTPGATYRIDYYALCEASDPATGEHFWWYDYLTVFQTPANKKGQVRGGSTFPWPRFVFSTREERVLVYRVEASGDVLVLEWHHYWY